MAFKIVGLDPKPFQALFALSDAELKAQGIVRKRADEHPGYPCRVSLEDAQVGEELLLLNVAHHVTESPYRGTSPIYVRRGATQATCVDRIPASLAHRLLSLRGYDADGMMIECDVVPGSDLRGVIERFFGNERVAYLHVHNAKPGCYACAIERV